MKKLIATLSTILIASALFAVVAPSGPQFSLNAQVDGILFHGFTTNSYADSDALLAANDTDTWNAEKYSLNLASDDSQVIGHYAFYSTKLEQTSVTFVTSPLSAKVINDTYYVPYALSYSSSNGNDRITLGDGNIGSADVATLTDPKTVSEKVLATNLDSTGLRYEILDLEVTFAGSENISFGLPEVNGSNNFYKGTITALIDAK
jgi:hypothetical protein